MDPFSAGFLSALGKEFANGVFGRLKQQITGAPARKALEHCLQVGLVALVAQATAAQPEQETELAGLFDRFFHDPDVWTEVARLAQDKPLDHNRLLESFTEAGYDAETLPHLDLKRAFDVFAAAYVDAAEWQPDLHGVIQTARLRQQLDEQRELREQVKELVAAVREQTAVAVRAGQVLAEGQARPVYQWHVGKVVNVAGSNFDMSGDFKQSILNFTTNYFEAGPNPQVQDEKQFKAALNRYLNWVVRTYGWLTLRGLKTREAGKVELELDEIYTSLAVEVDVEMDERKRRWTRRPPPGEGEPTEDGGRRTVDMAQLLALDDRLVITGGPGSGKTTYLHLIASSIARALVSGNGEPVERVLGLRGPLPLPVVVSLAGYNKYLRERRGNLIDYISHAIIEQNGAIGLPADFFSRLLVQGRGCFVLLDGLDEIPKDDERALVRRRVETLANNEGISRLIVTSRTRAYQGKSVFPYRLATVQPMTSEQVGVLAGRWCDAAYGPDERLHQKQSLRDEIEQLEALRAERGQPRLVDTPLLVTIVAIVHDNLNTLPQERAELYEECVKALLSEGYKELSEEQLALVGQGGKFNEKRNVLAQLAFEMMGTTDRRQSKEERARTTVQERQLLSWIRPLVVKLRGEERADGWLADFIDSMRERGSLLDERDGEYRFTHLTFQEFLAATYLGDTIGEADDIVSRLVHNGRVADSWWRETVLLTAGYIAWRSPDRALRLLTRLASVAAPAEGDVENAFSAAELAGVAFLEIGSHDEATCRTIASRLDTLLTNGRFTATNPLRGRAGLALGRLGDPRPDVSCPVPATVLIPSGPFVMGSMKGSGAGEDPLAFGNEEPRHEVKEMPEYRIGKYPVTVAQFRRFIEYVDGDGRQGYEVERYWTAAGRDWLKQSGQRAPVYWDDPTWNVDNHPVIGVSWYEAVAYCAWLTETNPGRFFRLPDEAMWEKAARGTDGRHWPWGNTWDAANLNAERTIGRTSAVGIFPAGSRKVNDKGERIYDCAGNVWEWCSGPGYSSGANYPLKPATYDEKSYLQEVTSAVNTRALRGGSWYGVDQNSRAAYRNNYVPHHWNDAVGFRVVELLSNPAS
jgi:formylglycine-generating enzyme required for sulfatase activity